jgi:Putative auto-transporter adhesin, head GIN domain
MKTLRKLSTVLFTIVILLASCNVIGERGNGNVVRQERKVSDFNAIEVSGAFDVFLSLGSTQSVIVEADENLQPIIRAEVHNSTLKIENKEPIRDSKSLKVYITVTDLKKIELSGAVDLQSQNKLTLSELSIEISGATDANLDIAVQKLEVSSSGGSKLKFSGMANKVNMDVSGAVDIHAFDLLAEIASLSISGAGDAEINVTKELYAEISGAGTVRYKGDPQKVDSNVSGAGSIKKAN